MGQRDFLNIGIHIDDLNIASGAIPQSAPTLVTHGYPSVIDDGGGIEVHAPFALVVLDIEAGVTPTAQLNLWGYVKPPSASPALLSDWQLIDSPILSDAVGLNPSFCLVPIAGFERFHVVVQAITGAPTSVRLRIRAIPQLTAEYLVAMGAVAGVSTKINLIEVLGVATGLTADGYQGVAIKETGGSVIPMYGDGDGRPRIAGEDAAGDPYPIRTSDDGRTIIGALTRQVPVATTDATDVSVITDLLQRLWIVSACFDPFSGSDLVTPTHTHADDYSSATWVDEGTGLLVVDSPFYFPAEEGFPTEQYDEFSGTVIITHATVTLEAWNGAGTDYVDAIDITRSAYNPNTNASIGVNITQGAAGINRTNFAVEVPYDRFRLKVVVVDNTNVVRLRLKYRKM